jgi:hypothetical protein
MGVIGHGVYYTGAYAEPSVVVKFTVTGDKVHRH